jgi:hypothetical protein
LGREGPARSAEEDTVPDEREPITTEPPDPLAGDESSVAKVGERLQEEADDEDHEDADDD